MKEKLLCIVTPDKRCYFRASLLATEFLDKDHNLVHTSGQLPDGEVAEFKVSTKTVKHYKNSKLDGELSMIDLATGQITFTEQYRDGVLIDLKDRTLHGTPIPVVAPSSAPTYDGTIVKINKNTRSFYVNGKEVAEVTVTPQGVTVEQLGNVPDGPVKEFDENGQVRTDATYRNNLVEGELLHYDEKGRLISRETYVSGKLHGPAQYFTYIMDGTIIVRANYKNMQLDGSWTSSFPNGDPCVEATYQNGKLQGTRTVLYHNGNLNIEENYENGRRQGQRLMYFPDGSLWYQENYKNGRLDGDRICFYPNGQKYLEEYYAEGLLEGSRTTYSEEGHLLSNEEYHWGTLLHNTERKPLTK